MNTMWLDIVVGLLLAVSIWRGWQRGLLTTVAAVAGLVAGSVVGSRVAAWLIEALHLSQLARVPVSVVIVIASAVTISSITSALGQRIRKKITWKPGGIMDSVGGVALDVCAVLTVVWMLASAVSVVPGQFSRDVRSSRTIHAIDSVMPDAMDAALAQLIKALDNSGAPRVFFSFGGIRAPMSGSVDEKILRNPDVLAAARSVVRISGASAGCPGTVVGSGFVFAPNRVMTNAHVVAGMRHPSVQVRGDARRVSTVVFFDPRIDIAVLAVTTTGWPSLRIDDRPQRGSSAAAIGYPGGGPLTTVAASVADVFQARGSDIYGGGAVTRSVIAVRADIRQGDSGGALVDGKGHVRGVVFAVSQDEPSLGYALTPDDVAAAVRIGTRNSEPVSTGRCARHE